MAVKRRARLAKHHGLKERFAYDEWDNYNLFCRAFANIHWLHRDSPSVNRVLSFTSIEQMRRQDDGERFIMSTGPLGIIRVRKHDYKDMCDQIRSWINSIEQFGDEQL